MSIEILNVSKYYGQQKALDNINLKIEGSSTTGLLGPNGAGKTTLMNCITDIIKYEEGDIFIEHMNNKESAYSIKKHIGFLPENNPLYPDMFIKEYLQFVANIFHVSKSRVEEVIEQVGLLPEQHKKKKQLSKGYKQRVGLAQAILNNPKYLILDEPTNGLDPNQIIEIRKLISSLSQDKTVILSTHIMQEVEALCEKVFLFNHGKILTYETLENFKGQYANLEEAFHQYTQAVV